MKINFQAPGATGPSNVTTPVTPSGPTFFTPTGQNADEVGEASEIIALVAGSHHSLALMKTGEMFAWGDNFFGQLGLGYSSENREPDRFQKTQSWRQPEMIDTPQRIKHFDFLVVEKRMEIEGNRTVEKSYTVQITGKIEGTPKDDDGNEASITQLDAGNFQSIALSRDGAIYIW
jgi:alpha-tubulin suppressor-like RCC1 family protein